MHGLICGNGLTSVSARLIMMTLQWDSLQTRL